MDDRGAARAQIGNGGKRMSTGSIFFKTKLCSRFRAGNCPYTNCNFAHGTEELRKPPPGWEEFVNPPVVPDDGGGAATATGGNATKLRPCKKFFAEGICPYGERCIFSHEDPAVKPAAVATSPVGNSIAATNSPKPLNWKTRLCNKWETTGLCPFGENCHFAHGIAELQRYGGGGRDPPMDFKGSQRSSDKPEAMPSPTTNFSHPQHQQQKQQKQQLHLQLQHQSSPQQTQQPQIQPSKPPQAPPPPPSSKVWRGPTEPAISTIYGDWLEEDEDDEDEDEDDNHPAELFYEEIQNFN